MTLATVGTPHAMCSAEIHILLVSVLSLVKSLRLAPTAMARMQQATQSVPLELLIPKRWRVGSSRHHRSSRYHRSSHSYGGTYQHRFHKETHGRGRPHPERQSDVRTEAGSSKEMSGTSGVFNVPRQQPAPQPQRPKAIAAISNELSRRDHGKIQREEPTDQRASRKTPLPPAKKTAFPAAYRD